MVRREALLAAVEEAFERTALGLRRWDDPHPDRAPTDDEYSRCLDPAKWSIIVARAEAWVEALETVGLADVERGATVEWAREHSRAMTWDSIDVLRPRGGGLPLVFAYRSWGDCIDLNAVTIGAGAPVVEVSAAPGCGCDACDHGSEMELRAFDDAVLELLTGGVRYLWRDDERIKVTRFGRSTVGALDDDEIDVVLADPSGWNEVRGAGWLPDLLDER
jgi:hypothetical protein